MIIMVCAQRKEMSANGSALAKTRRSTATRTSQRIAIIEVMLIFN